MTSLDRKLERCRREIAAQRAAEEAARGPRNGLTVAEPDLPDGVWQGLDDKGRPVFKAQCRSCHGDYELCHDVADFSDESNYCYGSPRCCP